MSSGLRSRKQDSTQATIAPPPSYDDALNLKDIDASRSFNTSLIKAIVLTVTGQVILLLIMVDIAWTMEEEDLKPSWSTAPNFYRLPKNPLIPHEIVAFFLFGYYIIAIFWFRFRVAYGSDVIYELLWGCNSGMLMSVVALLLDNTLLLAMCVAVVSVDQSLCWLDLIIRAITGKWPLGVISYLEDPTCPYIKKITSVHHFFFLPLCLLQLRGVCMPFEAYWMCVICTSYLSIWSRLTTPKYHIIKDKKKGTERIEYANINLSHEFWKDIHIPPRDWLHAFDRFHPAIYFPFLFITMNAVVLPFFLLFQSMSCIA